MHNADFKRNWRDIATSFLKIGGIAYGGPAIMGIMQAELQEKRRWCRRERLVEGLSLVNMIPGATATQLAGAVLGRAAEPLVIASSREIGAVRPPRREVLDVMADCGGRREPRTMFVGESS